MQPIGQQLGTPVYLKGENDAAWPKDSMFYLLTRDGLFLCRNHQWFKSCARIERGPSELGEQKSFVELNYPLIPRALVEKAIGFFHQVYKSQGWEAALLIAWNTQTQQVELFCPDQKANSAHVDYEFDALPPHLMLIGDLHSHGSWSPHASGTDEGDETHRPGLHIVVGNINREPPDLYCAAVVDGKRFEVTPVLELFEDYIQRDKNFPPEWLAKVKEKKYTTTTYYGGSYGGSYMGGEDELGVYHERKPVESDRKKIKKVLAKFLERDQCPTMIEVRQELYMKTHHVTYLGCERKAEKFIDHWVKLKARYEKATATK